MVKQGILTTVMYIWRHDMSRDRVKMMSHMPKCAPIPSNRYDETIFFFFGFIKKVIEEKRQGEWYPPRYKIFWFTRSFHSIRQIITPQKGFLCRTPEFGPKDSEHTWTPQARNFLFLSTLDVAHRPLSLRRSRQRLGLLVDLTEDQPRNCRSYKLLWWIHTLMVTLNKFSFVVQPTTLGNSCNMHKSKMAVQHIKWYKSCCNSKTIRENLICNSLFLWYDDWLGYLVWNN